MASAEIRGVVHGHTVVLSDDSCALPDGTEVVVTPVMPRRGDPDALFAALDELPPMSDEDAALILRIVEEGRKVDPADWD